MLHKKSFKAIMLLSGAIIFSATVFTACGGGNDKAANADTTTVQSTPAPDTTSSQADTSITDSANPRPVKGPN